MNDQGFLYGDAPSQTSRPWHPLGDILVNAKTIGFYVSAHYGMAAIGKTLAITVQLRNAQNGTVYFEYAWGSQVELADQSDTVQYEDFPDEIKKLTPGLYTYYAAILETEDLAFSERKIAALARSA